MAARVPGGDGTVAARRTWPVTTLVGLVGAVVVASAVGRWALIAPVRRLPELAGPVLPTHVVGPFIAVALAGLGALVVVRAANPTGLLPVPDMAINVTWLAVTLATVGLVVTLGFAVLRFRLYDVDLVINRTLVYTALTVVIVATYVLIVVGVGAWLPVEQTFLSLVATGIVAVAFAPLRTRLQRWANRLMFGQRDDPYVVLSELGRLVSRSGAPEATLQSLVETVATTLKLPGVAVELEQDGAWQSQAASGRVPDADADGIVVPMRYQGELVGRLVVTPRSSRERLSSADHRLLADIAHQTGALAHAARLTMALQRSREQLVLAREEERRRIRRDLHDGLGPSLASQTNQELVADIRRLVYELRPPALDQLGLAGALAAHAGQLDRTASHG